MPTNALITNGAGLKPCLFSSAGVRERESLVLIERPVGRGDTGGEITDSIVFTRRKNFNAIYLTHAVQG